MDKLRELEILHSDWSACDKCPLSQTRTQVVFGNGNPDANLVMIGEAPGENEDLEGQPFIGKAGEVFNKLLEYVGINRNELWITNTCLCRPKIADHHSRTNRAPSASEILSCSPRLLRELDIIQPKIIVLAGNTPLLAVTRKRGITKNRGWQDVEWHGKTFISTNIFSTLHPASLLYGSAEQIKLKKLWMADDWKEISRKLNDIKTVQKEGS